MPTITFRLLYCLVILCHGRRLWVSFGVTTNPTAEWISRQITEAFPLDSVPRYLIRDRDTAYGLVFVQRLRAMGIRDKPTAPRSPAGGARARASFGVPSVGGEPAFRSHISWCSSHAAGRWELVTGEYYAAGAAGLD
jgi:hypothetical protein